MFCVCHEPNLMCVCVCVCPGFQFAQELRNKVWPSFRQAGGRPHPLSCTDFVPTNCHVNLMQVSYPKSTTSAGRTFSIRFGRKNSLFGLDPDQGRGACSHFFCPRLDSDITTVSSPSQTNLQCVPSTFTAIKLNPLYTSAVIILTNYPL